MARLRILTNPATPHGRPREGSIRAARIQTSRPAQARSLPRSENLARASSTIKVDEMSVASHKQSVSAFLAFASLGFDGHKEAQNSPEKTWNHAAFVVGSGGIHFLTSQLRFPVDVVQVANSYGEGFNQQPIDHAISSRVFAPSLTHPLTCPGI
jgi:hypothetical protein